MGLRRLTKERQDQLCVVSVEHALYIDILAHKHSSHKAITKFNSLPATESISKERPECHQSFKLLDHIHKYALHEPQQML